ncbi:MAG: glycosyltransferase [Duncaniella sp.]|nr:glycosyltransferase [Duncaniella sp.]
MHPRVSVIIITYNQADTISRAIESVLAQTGHTSFEILLADDASTDGTRAICEDYARRFPTVIRLMPKSPNKGVVRNYFDAFKACRGEFVTDCAGDDYWTDSLKLDRLSALLDAHPEATVAFSDWTMRNAATGHEILGSEHPDALPTDGRVIPGAEVMMRVMNHTSALPYNLTASLVRREPVANLLNSTPEQLCNPSWGCEDVPLMAFLASIGDAVGCPISTYIYNVESGSVSNGESEVKRARFYLRVMRCHRDLAHVYAFPMMMMTDFFIRKADYVVSLAFNSGDCDLARDVAAELSRWHLPTLRRTRIQLSLMSSPLWSITRTLKIHFKALKGKFRLNHSTLKR